MYKIGQFLLNSRHGNKNNFCDIFISQIDAQKEILAGKLFIVMDINSRKNEGIKIAQFLVNFLNHTYYNNEKIILREKVKSLKPEHIFESVIAKTNSAFNEFLKKEKIKLSSSNYNITIGLVFEDNIYFTGVGKNKIFLIYNHSENPDEKTIYKLADLSNKTKEDEVAADKNSPKKIFANILSGKIPEKGFMVFSNEALPEYITKKNIIEIVTTLPPGSAVEQIKNTLQKINEYISFVGIIIKNTKTPLIELEKKLELDNKQSVSDSINTLNSTEDNTEKYLSPTGAVKSRWLIDTVLRIFKKEKSKISKNQNNKLFLEGSTPIIKKNFAAKFGKIFSFFKLFFAYIFNAIYFIVSSFKSKDRILNLFKSIGFGVVHFIKYRLGWIMRIDIKIKALISVLLFLAVLLTYGIYTKDKENKIVENNQEYLALTESIEQKQNQADASILYNNETGAQKIITEVEDLLSTFPQDTPEKAAQYNLFKEKFNSQLNKIRRITLLDKPEIITNFNDLNNNAQVNNFIVFNDTIYSADPAQKTIYAYDLKSKESKIISEINDAMDTMLYPVSNSEGTIFWFNGNSIIEFDTNDQQISKMSITLPSGADIKSMSIFNNRLYLLDAASSQIYRYTRTQNGYTTYNEWLEEDTNLSQAVDMYIDGNIYILFNDGHPEKWLKGRKIDFMLTEIDPPVTEAQKIFISETDTYIYLFDKAENRIIVYKKNGDFVMQYYIQNTGLTNYFLVNENEKLIYYLNDKSIIYKTELTHLAN